MARNPFRPARPKKLSAPRPITSAAAPVRLNRRSDLEMIRARNAVSRTWQLEAWRTYDVLGEINFAFNLIANAFSRIRFHAAVAVNPDEAPVEVADGSTLDLGGGKEVGARGGVDPRLAERAREFMSKLNTGHGMATLQRAYALNRMTAGECYLCLIEDEWSIKSTFELLVDSGGTMKLQPSITTGTIPPRDLPQGSSVYRMWSPHPRYSGDPDAGLRSVLYLCEQLIRLNRMISNTIASRMNAGILQIATQIADAARTPGTEDNINDDPATVPETDPFDTMIMNAMMQPVQDDQAGAAVIPVILKHDHAYMDGVKWTSLARDIDQHMTLYAENLLGRILNGINIPKDAITGFQNVRYANAQQITQDTFTQAVEPLALAFCDDLTDIYLKPLLKADMLAAGWEPEQVDKMVVWYDPSEVVTRPDRGADADAGWDRGALSNDAWRRAHGFSADDAPSDEELMQRTLMRSAQLPPNLIDYVARKLWPEYFEDAPPLVTQNQAGMNQAATAPLGAHVPRPGAGAEYGGPQPQAPRNPANEFRLRGVPNGQPRQDANDAGSMGDLNPNGTLPPRDMTRTQ